MDVFELLKIYNEGGSVVTLDLIGRIRVEFDRLQGERDQLTLLAQEQAETIDRLRQSFEIPTVTADDDLSEGPVAISYTDHGRTVYGAAENLPCAVALAFVDQQAARDWWKRNEAKIHAERSRPDVQLLPLRRAIPVETG